MTPAQVPVDRSDTLTRDQDEVHEIITRRYVAHRPHMIGDNEEFEFRSRSAWAGGLILDQSTYGARLTINADPFDAVIVLSLLDGRFEMQSRRQVMRAGRGDSMVYPFGVPLNFFMDRSTYQIAQFPLEAPRRIAARLGVEPADFRFDAMAPISDAMGHHWRATMAYLMTIFSGPSPAARHPLMLSAAMETAAASVLASFPNTTMSVGYTAGPGHVAPAVVRRAVEYMDANAAAPLTLEEIAGASGVGVRALQAAFKRHRDTSPKAYLRRVRLERAHQELLAAQPGDGSTVAEIARRWGFHKPSRFTAAYRDAIGELPSHTLRT